MQKENPSLVEFQKIKRIPHQLMGAPSQTLFKTRLSRLRPNDTGATRPIHCTVEQTVPMHCSSVGHYGKISLHTLGS